MPWIIPATFAYFFLALSSVLDRFLLAGPLPNTRAYAFTTSLTSAFALFFIPFADFHVPTNPVLVLAIFTGIVNLFALTSLFQMVRLSNVSRSVPMMGAMLPICTLVFSSLAVPDSYTLNPRFLLALAFLALGTLTLSFKPDKHSLSFSRRDFGYATLTAMLVAASTILTKSVYSTESFLNGLIWINFGTFFSALALLFFSDTRNAVTHMRSWSPSQIWLPFLTGKVTGGLGGLLQQYAIFRAERFAHLALINAMQGLQYIFLLIFVGALSLAKPALLKEELTAQTIPLRLIGILLIALGISFVLTA